METDQGYGAAGAAAGSALIDELIACACAADTPERARTALHAAAALLERLRCAFDTLPTSGWRREDELLYRLDSARECNTDELIVPLAAGRRAAGIRAERADALLRVLQLGDVLAGRADGKR
ncbi:hypothetical protein D9M68_362060 [compost metagenome]